MDAKIDYKITASQLNSFSWYLKNEKENAEQELLDTLDRIKAFSTEPQSKGKCFEHIVNSVLNKDELYSSILANFDYICIKYTEWDVDGVQITFDFCFKTSILNKIIRYLQKHNYILQQHYLSDTIEIDNKVVELYGYADYIAGWSVIDLKTTANYEYPKYLTNWQRYVYLYCLGEAVEYIEFVATNFDEVFVEKYNIKDTDFNDLREALQMFIEFLDKNKAKITDKKIFGGEKGIATEFSTEIQVKGKNEIGVKKKC